MLHYNASAGRDDEFIIPTNLWQLPPVNSKRLPEMLYKSLSIELLVVKVQYRASTIVITRIVSNLV